MESLLMTVGRHMEEDEVERYSMQEMSDVESGPFEEHLLICEVCRNRVQEADIYVSAMQCAGTQARGAPPKRAVWSWSFGAAWAVAVALVVLAASFLMR